MSNLQLDILKTFSMPLPENKIIEIRVLSAAYSAEKVDEEAFFKKNNWDVNEKVKEWSEGHIRIPYHTK